MKKQACKAMKAKMKVESIIIQDKVSNVSKREDRICNRERKFDSQWRYNKSYVLYILLLKLMEIMKLSLIYLLSLSQRR